MGSLQNWHHRPQETSAPISGNGTAMNVEFDQSVVGKYARDGAVVLRGVFADWVEPLRAGLQAIMTAPSPLRRVYTSTDGSAPFFQDLYNWRRIPEFEDFVRHSPAARAAARLMSSGKAQFFHDHVLVKEPGSSVVTPWHQDMPFYCVGGDRTVSF